MKKNKAAAFFIFLFLLCLCAEEAQSESAVTAGDDSQSETLPPMTAKMKASLEKGKSLEGFKIIACSEGDLNGDGLPDKAVVLEEGAEDKESLNLENPARRYIAVLLRLPEGGFKCAYSSAGLILDSQSGGVFGNPFSGLEIKNGELTISHYGGASFRWAYDMTFRDVSGEFRLTKLNNENMHAGTGNGERTVCDFISNTVERRSASFVEEGEKSPSLLLYKGNLDGKTYLFDTANFQEIISNAEIKHLPNLGSYNFMRFKQAPRHVISPVAALDKVKEKYYHAFVKVKLPLTPEMLKNYEKLLSHEVPEYYYQGKNGDELEYFKMEIFDDGEGNIINIVHGIIHTQPGAELFDKLYRVTDSTGGVDVL